LAAAPIVGGTVMLYETEDWWEWRSLHTSALQHFVFSVCLFGNGRLVAVGSSNGSVSVLEAATGALLTTFRAYDEPEYGDITLGAIAGSPDGDMVFIGVGSVTFNGQNYQISEANAWAAAIEPVRILRMRDGARLGSLTAAARPIRHAVWDPKGRYVAFVDNARGLFLWQTTVPGSGFKRVELSGPTLALAVTADGGRLAVTTDHGVSVFAIN
jgi:hypothetical protein